MLFLSTPSARRATWIASFTSVTKMYFYPRPPRGGRLAALVDVSRGNRISIHALREEGDHHAPQHPLFRKDFYPRPPRGGRRYILQAVRARMQISIHALREEGDALHLEHYPVKWNFYPRPPRGGRRYRVASKTTANRNFYPRPPRGGRHKQLAAERKAAKISIHALREEGDGPFGRYIAPAIVFLSTPSARRATSPWAIRPGRNPYFYPRPPRGGRPASCKIVDKDGNISIHALREEGDQTNPPPSP